MKTLHLSCLALLFFVWLSPYGVAQLVTVRVINATNGHPLQKQQVSISLLYEKGERLPEKYDANLQLETDVNGAAQFRLPEPAPAHISAHIRLTSERWHCGCMTLATTLDVVERGLAVGPTGSDSKEKESVTLLKAQPGEILFVARPLTFLERLLYPLVKG